MIRLYHGSTCEIEQIDLNMSKPNKDFGRGFYLSKEVSQALELAEYKAFQIGGTPVINTYEFDDSYLNNGILNVMKFDSYSKEWAQFVFDNRTSEDGGSTHQYDIVVGPMPMIGWDCRFVGLLKTKYPLKPLLKGCNI